MMQFLLHNPISNIVNHFLQPYLAQHADFNFLMKDGLVTIENLVFDVTQLDKFISKFNLPFLIKDCTIDKVLVETKFSPSFNLKVIIKNLKSTVIPLEPTNYANVLDSMLDSFYDSPESIPISKILEQFDQKDGSYDNTKAKENSELLLSSLGKVFEIWLDDTSVRIEHLPETSSNGIALELKIDKIRMYPEGQINKAANASSGDSSWARTVSIVGVSFYTEEIKRTLLNESCYSSAASQEPMTSMLKSDMEDSRIFYKEECTQVKFAEIFGETLLIVSLFDKVNHSEVNVLSSIPDVALFITPRQVFLLSELLSRVSERPPSSGDLENVPMTVSDYDLLERRQVMGATNAELSPYCDADTNSHGRLHSGSVISGWSKPQPKQHETAQYFLNNLDTFSQTNGDGSVYDYIPHYAQSVVSTDVGSVVPQSDITFRTQKFVNSSVRSEAMTRSRDWMKDPINHVVETQLELKVSSLLAVVLHEDVIVPEGDASQREQQCTAHKYFEKIHSAKLKSFVDDISCGRNVLNQFFNKNHFQLVASKLVADVRHSQHNQSISVSTLARIHNMEVVECVQSKNGDVNFQFVELLTFKNVELLEENNCLCIDYKCKSEIRNTCKDFIDTGNTKTSLSFALTDCIVEVDLSLIDRAEAFFKQPIFFNEDFATKVSLTASGVQDASKDAVAFRNDAKLSCSCSTLDIRLRFPIPDLRPMSDVLTKEIWKRDVRSDILTLSLSDLTANTQFSSPVNDCGQKLLLSCGSGFLVFQESHASPQHIIAEFSSINDLEPISMRCDFASDADRVWVTNPKLARTCYGNKIPEAFVKGNLGGSNVDHFKEPFLYPPDQMVFSTFMQHACRGADINFTAILPYVKIVLPSKHIYEVLYNRLAYDLMLWQPLSSHPIYDTKDSSASVADLANDIDFILGNSMTDSIYHSFTCDDNSVDPRSRKSVRINKKNMLDTTKLGLLLKIYEGQVEIHTPFITAHGDVDENVHGRVLVDVRGLSVYVAAAYHGDPNKSYVGVYANDFAVLHHSKWFSEELDSTVLSNSRQGMNVVVDKCTKDILEILNPKSKTDTQDLMLNLVMAFDFDEIRNVNTMNLAVKVQQAMYKHRNVALFEQWFSQLKEFFIVEDYPICGYQMPDIINDLHCSVVSCVVRCHPESLSSEAFVYIGCLSLASSLSYTCDITVFRISIGDSTLYFAKNFGTRRNQRVFAKIVESGTMHFTTRHTLRKLKSIPEQEFIIAGLGMTVTVSPDSLYEAIEYANFFLASDEPITEELVEPVGSSSSLLSVSEQDRRLVGDLIAEAINDGEDNTITPISQPVTASLSKPQELPCYSPFTFPDDNADDAFEVYRPQYDEQCTVLCSSQTGISSSDYSVTQLKCTAWPSKKTALKPQVRACEMKTPLMRLNVVELSFKWKLCNGSAFLAKAVVPKAVLYSAKSSRVSLHQSSGARAQNQSIMVRGQECSPLVQINVKKIRYCFESFAQDNPVSHSHLLILRDAEILDLVPASTLNKLLCRLSNEHYPIGDNSEFLIVNYSVRRRPEETNELSKVECYLDISLGNVRMYVDQATVTFLTEFFRTLNAIQEERSKIIIQDEFEVNQRFTNSSASARPVSIPEVMRPFFKSVIFKPAAVIIIDFEGNFSEISSVHEFILAMSSANNIVVKLKEINYQRGLLGVDKVIEYFKREWLDDFYVNQKMGLVKLFAPVGLVMEIIGGFWELVDLPIQHYMRDGNMFRGLMLGSKAFTQRSMAATFGLLGKVFNCLENIASFLMVVVSRNHRVEGPRVPPSDAVSGMYQASGLVRDRVQRITADVIESTRAEGRERGVAGALSGIGRHVPEILVTGPLVATQVSGCIMTGLQQQWRPENKKELQQKYK